MGRTSPDAHGPWTFTYFQRVLYPNRPYRPPWLYLVSSAASAVHPLLVRATWTDRALCTIKLSNTWGDSTSRQPEGAGGRCTNTHILKGRALLIPKGSSTVYCCESEPLAHSLTRYVAYDHPSMGRAADSAHFFTLIPTCISVPPATELASFRFCGFQTREVFELCNHSNRVNIRTPTCRRLDAVRSSYACIFPPHIRGLRKKGVFYGPERAIPINPDVHFHLKQVGFCSYVKRVVLRDTIFPSPRGCGESGNKSAITPGVSSAKRPRSR